MLKTKEERLSDLNPQETSEWLEALDQIVDEAGPDRASYLLEKLLDRASGFGVFGPRDGSRAQPDPTAKIPSSGQMKRPKPAPVENWIEALCTSWI